MARPELFSSVMVPKPPLAGLVFGLRNIAWFRALIASARNWTVVFSVTLVFLRTERFHWLIPSPRTPLKRELRVR